MGKHICGVAALVIATLAFAAPSAAQEWKKATKDEKAAKTVEYKAAVQAGMIITTGNSETTTMSAGAKGSRKEGFNKFQAAVNGAYARSSVFVFDDINGDMMLSENEISRASDTTTRSWDVLARYDRFLTESNSLYAMAKVGADKPAGKKLVAGAQAGYSRRLFKNDKHELLGEAGYDFSFEDFPDADGVSIHSARGFFGYTGKLTQVTGLNASGEVLSNVNTINPPGGEVGPLEDTRLTGTLELSTKLHDNISFSFGFVAKYDNAPAPRPALGLEYAPGFVPLADELDTITKASLIINFL